MTGVTATIWGPDGTEHRLVLGDFHEVWTSGVTVGSDPDCTIELPGLPQVAVLVFGLGNHKLMVNLPPEARLPVARESSNYDRRVDYGPFEVGRYVVQFGEV